MMPHQKVPLLMQALRVLQKPQLQRENQDKKLLLRKAELQRERPVQLMQVQKVLLPMQALRPVPLRVRLAQLMPHQRVPLLMQALRVLQKPQDLKVHQKVLLLMQVQRPQLQKVVQ